MKLGSRINILFKIFLLILVPITISYLIIFVFPIPVFSFQKEGIIIYLRTFNKIAPMVYILLQALTVLIVPIPSVVLATAGGALFGFWKAVPYTTLAWILGTSINFYIARLLGRTFLSKIIKKEELKTVDNFANNIGWKLILFSWFVPGGTADVAGYAAGLTKMKYLKYFIPALMSAFLLSIFTSAAGAAFTISPLLTLLFTLGAALGIIFGVKILLLFSLVKKGLGYIKTKLK